MGDNYAPRHVAAVPDDGTTAVEYQQPLSMMFSNRTYDKLKWVAQILVPALATFYGAVGLIWGLPYVGQVIGTLAAFDTLLGALLQISTKAYEASGSRFDGALSIVQHEEGDKTLALDLDAHPEDLEGQKEVTLKVNLE